MTGEGDRAQDAGRSHKRRPAGLDPETAELLERYRATFRAELADTLAELRPSAGDQLTFAGAAERIRPALEVRRQLVSLAALLARELANGGDLDLGDPAPAGAAPARRARAPRLSARERAALEST